MTTSEQQQKQITKSEHLQLIGLSVLAKNHMKELAEIERAMAEILNVPNEGGRYYGHVSDMIYSDITLEETLVRLQVKVRK